MKIGKATLRCDSCGAEKMRKLLLVMFACTLLLPAYANEKAVWPAPAKALRGAEYTIYSGRLGDEGTPTKDDGKLSIEISGQAAKEIFESIYPDAKATCSADKGERLRRKRDLWCSYRPDEGYKCFLGFNLWTGESIPGGSC